MGWAQSTGHPCQLYSVVGRLKFPLMLEITTLYISIFWLVHVIIISIFLYSTWSGFRFSRSTSVADAYELPAPVSNSALQVIPSTSTTTTRYTTGPSPVATISWVGFLSQIELWCLPLHFWQLNLHRQSAARCFVPVQLKHNLLLLRYLFLSATSLILSQLTDLCSTDLQ